MEGFYGIEIIDKMGLFIQKTCDNLVNSVRGQLGIAQICLYDTCNQPGALQGIVLQRFVNQMQLPQKDSKHNGNKQTEKEEIGHPGRQPGRMGQVGELLHYRDYLLCLLRCLWRRLYGR